MNDPQNHYQETQYEDYSVPVNTSQVFYKSMKIFGTKAALTVCESTSKSGFHTINIESASATGLNKTFDWKNKLAQQVTAAEFPMILAVMYGWIPKIEFSGRGGDNRKSLFFEHQGTHLFVKSCHFKPNEKGIMHVLPVNPVNTFELANFMLSSYLQNYPMLDARSVLDNLRLTVGKMHSK